MGVLQSDAFDALAYIEEILHWEIVFFFLQTPELAYLRKPFIYRTDICGEGNLIHLFLAQRAQTTRLQQFAYFVESYLLFEVVWVNHAAKVRISERFSKYFIKSCLKICSIPKKALPLHPLLRQTSTGEMVEWSITVVLKTTVPRGTGGSNPSLSAKSSSLNSLFFVSHAKYQS